MYVFLYYDITADGTQKMPDGVMTIKFKDQVSAHACVTKMNGRFFDGRKVSRAFLTPWIALITGRR